MPRTTLEKVSLAHYTGKNFNASNNVQNSAAVQRARPKRQQSILRSELSRVCLQGVNLNALGGELKNIHAGMIIWSAMHEEDYKHTNVPALHAASGMSSNIRTDTNGINKVKVDCVTFSRWGPIHTKPRYMIVVALFKEHYLAIPCYTHNGLGVSGKPHKNEFLPVSHSKTSDPNTLVIANWHAPQRIDPMTSAHVMRPVSRAYGLHGHYSGELDLGSTYQLVRLYNKVMGDIKTAGLR